MNFTDEEMIILLVALGEMKYRERKVGSDTEDIDILRQKIRDHMKQLDRAAVAG